MLAKLPLAERILVRAQDRSPTYVSGVGGGADVEAMATDKEAMATNLGFPLVFPFDFGPCPSIPPPFAKQWSRSCDFFPQFEHKTPLEFFLCL